MKRIKNMNKNRYYVVVHPINETDFSLLQATFVIEGKTKKEIEKNIKRDYPKAAYSISRLVSK